MAFTPRVRSTILLFAFSIAAVAQIDPQLYAGLKWRNIGPFRGGRISAVSGAIAQPGVFYAASSLGGVWKTVSAGATWFNVTDSVPEIANVTALEVAPSDANVVYLGAGDRGLGMYKTSDAGKTWRHIGLDQNHGIAAILVDPHDANLVLAATQGDPRAKSDQRGVYRSADGGRTWNKVLYKDDETGASSIVWAFDHPQVVYATMARHYSEPGAGRGGRGGGRGAGGAAPAGSANGRGGAAIAALAVSTVKGGVMWTGSSNGVLFVTQDGGAHWKDVTPAAIPAGSMAGVVEASHFDAAIAYAEVDRSAGGDDKPYIYRTRDYGQSWQPIVNGLPTDEPTGSFVRVVREDTVRRGLLFAGTETSVHVSFDDGDHWQPLRLNLPNTSYRDLVVHGNDLVAGTYGRSFFVLDDISPLRQLTSALVSRMAGQGSYLFKPGDAIRVRRNINMDTPLPPEVPHALNPPEGAILDYYLASKPAGEIKIEIYDAQNHLVRTLSSRPAPPFNEPLPPVPGYWLRPSHVLTTNVGANRTNWDLRYDDPPALSHNWAQVMSAVYQDTPYTPQGAVALPGIYTVKLTADGKTAAQTLTVHEDPRIGESAAVLAGLRAQFDLERKAVAGMVTSNTGYSQTSQLRSQLKALSGQSLPSAVTQGVSAVDAKMAPVQGLLSAAASGPYGVPAYTGNPGFTGVNGAFAGLMVIVEYESDHAPVDAQVKAFHDYCTDLDNNLALWRTINIVDLPALNEVLRKNNLTAITPASPPADLACGAAPAR